MATKGTILMFSALLSTAGCALTGPRDSDPPDTIGPLIASYKLTAEDGNPLPCCGVDSATVHITVVGGTLEFYGPGSYTDTAYTPGGVTSRACVHEVPNGSNLNTFTHTVTLPDGIRYLLIPCDRGTYALMVIRQLDQAGGSSSIDSVLVSSGTFSAKPDTVDLADAGHQGAFTASVTVPTILVTGTTHRYRFDPDSSLRSSAASELARVLHNE